jgi:hypothetical protein
MRRHHVVAGMGTLVAALAFAVPNGLSATTGREQVTLRDDPVVAMRPRNAVPFTTLDLALIVGGAGGLIAGGAALRQAAAKRA